MSPILFACGNKDKFANAEYVCEKAGIPLKQVIIDIDEIQGEDSRVIATAKAWAAYAKLQKPVVVSDDSWKITALNGFPGPYMKSMNYWFKPEDFLRLLSGATDRSVILHQFLVYCDGTEVIVFEKEIPGSVLEHSYGDDSKAAWMNVTTLIGDDGKSTAEIFGGPEATILERYKDRPDVWQDFVKWCKEIQS